MPFLNTICNEHLTHDVLDRKHKIEFSVHGLSHWLRVERNGLYLASHEGADSQVISLFALFHDSQRINDFDDPGHGKRGATLAQEFYSKGRLPITQEQFDILHYACCHHTDQLFHDNSTIQCCWDADRLDLTRISVIPDPAMLNTVTAKQVADSMDYTQIEQFKL